MNYKTITMLVLCDSKTLRWLESHQQVLKISKYKPWAPACYNLTFRDPASNTKLNPLPIKRLTSTHHWAQIIVQHPGREENWKNIKTLKKPITFEPWKSVQDCDGVSRNPIMIWLCWQHSITKTDSNLLWTNDWHARDPRKCDGVSGNPITFLAWNLKTKNDWFFGVWRQPSPIPRKRRVFPKTNHKMTFVFGASQVQYLESDGFSQKPITKWHLYLAPAKSNP